MGDLFLCRRDGAGRPGGATRWLGGHGHRWPGPFSLPAAGRRGQGAHLFWVFFVFAIKAPPPLLPIPPGVSLLLTAARGRQPASRIYCKSDVMKLLQVLISSYLASFGISFSCFPRYRPFGRWKTDPGPTDDGVSWLRFCNKQQPWGGFGPFQLHHSGLNAASCRCASKVAQGNEAGWGVVQDARLSGHQVVTSKRSQTVTEPRGPATSRALWSARGDEPATPNARTPRSPASRAALIARAICIYNVGAERNNESACR